MFSWIGLRQVGVPFRREERFAGETKYPFRKMLRLAIDGIVSFSAYPLRLALNVGFFVSGLSFVLGCVFIGMKLAGLWKVSGLASIAVFVAFLGGLQLFLLGIMGEYVARIHDEVKRRPLYVVGEHENFGDLPPLPPRAVVVRPRGR
jgi:dolichol-phosphate mannosyltransferase